MSEGFITRRGAGAAALNYTVIGGISRPTATKENTIWVNTATAIGSHIFSSTAPTTASAGQVWIKTGVGAYKPFNALKTNALMVYPLEAYQYKGSAWTRLPSYIYQGAAWYTLESPGAPAFTYTGTYNVITDDVSNWRIKFLTSGTLTFTDLKGASNGIDVFLVGGGGASGQNRGGGGGGGYTTTAKGIDVSVGTTYTITVGAGGTTASTGNTGGTSSAFGASARGGAGTSGHNGGNGGSGGGGYIYGGGANGSVGGSNGGRGGGGNTPGAGQGTTTREFGESSGALYAGGGAGGSTTPGASPVFQTSAGGAGGGGASGSGGNANNAGMTYAGSAGAANTGGGGGARNGNGGSGIVIIRNARAVQ